MAKTTTPKACSDCGRLPKRLPQHRCEWCLLRKQPSHIQAEAAKRRRLAIPEHLHAKRNNKFIIESTPEGTSFCAGCQSYMPLNHFGKNQTQCRGCVSGKTHEKRLESVYGIDSAEYERILKLQDERCAICGNKATGARRFATDHDHKTGKVRGLLCSGEYGCNKGLLGSAHDDPRMLWNAYVYLTNPPAEGGFINWWTFLDLQALPVVGPKAQAQVEKPLFSKPGNKPKTEEKAKIPDGDRCTKGYHTLPAGSRGVPGKPGVWEVWVDTNSKSEPF